MNTPDPASGWINRNFIGQTFDGSYRIDRFLGLGLTSSVFAATDIGTSTLVALKILDRDCSPEVAKVRARQAQRLATLSHPHLAEVKAWRENDSHRYLVMEQLPKETLSSLRRRLGGRIGLQALLPICRQIASALDAAHQANLVHGCLRPEHVFLIHTAEGAYQVKLAGFGPASPVAAYLSPERARGEPYDARADQFSLAVILYEMLTGRHPFVRRPSEDEDTIIDRILNEDPPPFKLPERVDRALRKALTRSPAWRFGSAGEFVAALDTEGTSAVGPIHGPRQTRRVRRWSRLRLTLEASLLGAVCLFAVIHFGLKSRVLHWRALSGRDQPPSQPSKIEASVEPVKTRPTVAQTQTSPQPAMQGPVATPIKPVATPMAPVATPIKSSPKPPRPAIPSGPQISPSLGPLEFSLLSCLKEIRLPDSYSFELEKADGFLQLVDSDSAPSVTRQRSFTSCLKQISGAKLPSHITIRRKAQR